MKNKIFLVLIIVILLIFVLVASYVTINKAYYNYKRDNKYIECCGCKDCPACDVCCECDYSIIQKLMIVLENK